MNNDLYSTADTIDVSQLRSWTRFPPDSPLDENFQILPRRHHAQMHWRFVEGQGGSVNVGT